MIEYILKQVLANNSEQDGASRRGWGYPFIYSLMHWLFLNPSSPPNCCYPLKKLYVNIQMPSLYLEEFIKHAVKMINYCNSDSCRVTSSLCCSSGFTYVPLLETFFISYAKLWWRIGLCMTKRLTQGWGIIGYLIRREHSPKSCKCRVYFTVLRPFINPASRVLRGRCSLSVNGSHPQ